MQQVIYADILVILNLIITFFLLLATRSFTKESGKNWRLLLGAVAGGVYSLQVFLPEMGAFPNFLSRLAAGILISLIAFGFRTPKRFLKICLVFVSETFAFAGLMIGLWIIFRPSGMVINNSTVYFGISLPVLIVSTTVCYLISLIFSKIVMRTKPQSMIYQITLVADGKTLTGRAMLDTGNKLSESFSGYPAVVCTYNFIEKILPEETKSFFGGEVTSLHTIKDEKWKKKTRLVTYSTVSSSGVLPAFRPDLLKVGKEITSDKVYVAVINYKKHINEGFDMLLNPDLF